MLSMQGQQETLTMKARLFPLFRGLSFLLTAGRKLENGHVQFPPFSVRHRDSHSRYTSFLSVSFLPFFFSLIFLMIKQAATPVTAPIPILIRIPVIDIKPPTAQNAGKERRYLSAKLICYLLICLSIHLQIMYATTFAMIGRSRFSAIKITACTFKPPFCFLSLLMI